MKRLFRDIVAHFADEREDFGALKCILACSHALMIVQTVMLSYFSVYNFLTSSNVIQIVTGFVFLDINMF